jgi:hypothetical protein
MLAVDDGCWALAMVGVALPLLELARGAPNDAVE